MAKETLNDLALRLKKLAKTSQKYTDDTVAASVAAEKVELIEQATAESGYMKTYILARGTTEEAQATGDKLIGKINIPKDFLVKSATIETVTTADVPYQGAQVGDKYIDFVINTKDSASGTATDSHVYLPVNDLVDIYTGSDAITVGQDNSISLKLGTNTNGLVITTGQGLELNLATGSSAGAQSAAGKQQELDIAKDYVLMTNAEIISWFGYDPTKMNTAGTSEKALADMFGASGFADSLTDQS